VSLEKKIIEYPGRIKDKIKKVHEIEDHLRTAKQHMLFSQRDFTRIQNYLSDFFIKTLPLLTLKEHINNYALMLSMFITFMLKYPSNFRTKLIDTLLPTLLTLNKNLPIIKYPHYYVFQNVNFFKDCLALGVPMSHSFINNISIIEGLLEMNLQCLIIVDPTNAFYRYYSEKNKGIELCEWMTDSNTDQIIEDAVLNGKKLLVRNFDQALFRKFMPIIEWKNRVLSRKLFRKFLLVKEETPKEGWVDDQSLDRQIILNGKTSEVHKKFKILFISKPKTNNVFEYIYIF
jgi:hypothetical protein